MLFLTDRRSSQNYFDLSISCVSLDLSIKERFLVSLYGFQGAALASGKFLSHWRARLLYLSLPLLSSFFSILFSFLFPHDFPLPQLAFFAFRASFAARFGRNIFYILLDIRGFKQHFGVLGRFITPECRPPVWQGTSSGRRADDFRTCSLHLMRQAKSSLVSLQINIVFIFRRLTLSEFIVVA